MLFESNPSLFRDVRTMILSHTVEEVVGQHLKQRFECTYSLFSLFSFLFSLFSFLCSLFSVLFSLFSILFSLFSPFLLLLLTLSFSNTLGCLSRKTERKVLTKKMYPFHLAFFSCYHQLTLSSSKKEEKEESHSNTNHKP